MAHIMSMLGKIKPGQPKAQGKALTTATIRQFDGLWNPSDSDLNLRADYSKWMTNVERGTDGTPTVRYGYRREFGHYQSIRYAATMIVKPAENTITIQSNRWTCVGGRIRVSGVPDGDYKGISSSRLNDIRTVSEVGDGEFKLLLEDWTDGTPGDLTVPVFIQETVSNAPYVKGLEYTGSRLAFTTDGWLLEFSEGDVHALWSPNIGHFSGLIDDTATITINAGEQWAYVAFTDNEDLDPDEPIRLFVDTPIGDYTAEQLNRYFVIVDQTFTAGIHYHVIRLPFIATTTVTDVAIDGQYNISEDWAEVDHISYAQFGQRITFTNGIDKPIVLDWTNNDSATYLVDPVSGSNLNTPVAKYVVAGSSYTIHIGLINEPGVISISATNTDNTFLGDTGPNDAVEINVAKTAVDANAQPTGGIFHNGLLFIFFEDATVIYRLGVFKDDLHTPELVQTIQSFGCISHDALASIGQTLLAVDTSGVVSIQETLVGDSFKPVRLSELITKELLRDITSVNKDQWYRIHQVYDKRNGRYMLFVPTDTEGTYNGYIYQRLEEKKVSGWTKYTNINFVTAFRDSYGRIYGSLGNAFYVLGNDQDPIYTDNGNGIPFVWELPWQDFRRRMLVKQARYIAIESQGTERFTMSLFTDWIYEDVATIINNPGTVYDEYTLPLLPETEVEFVGGDIDGYGTVPQPYGGGRKTNDPRAFAWTARFKVAKLRFSGTATERLGWVSISIAYQLGDIYR